MPAHDYFNKMLAGVLGQLFEAEIVNYLEFRVEVTPQGSVLPVEGFVLHEVARQFQPPTVVGGLRQNRRQIPAQFLSKVQGRASGPAAGRGLRFRLR
jgi:hypothetical protein